MHNHLAPGHSRRGGNHDEQHGPLVPNDVIPMSDGSSPHRSIFTPIEIVQLDRRVTRLEVVTESISARLDEQKVEFRDFRVEMNARFDKVDDRFEKLDAKFDAKFERLDAKFDAKLEKLDEKIERLDAKLDVKFEKLDEKIERIDAKFDEKFEKLDAKFDVKLDKLDAKGDANFDRVDARFDEVRIHARSDFHLLFGSLIATALGLAGMMAKGFGWF